VGSLQSVYPNLSYGGKSDNTWIMHRNHPSER
jgi:hypothetical protein